MAGNHGTGYTASNSGVTTGGVLAQLIALGAADTHLTNEPEVTFWRLHVQKSTNFAIESITQGFTGSATFGGTGTLTLNRTGDLVYWMYVIVDLPAIYGEQSAGHVTTYGHADVSCDACEDGNEDLCGEHVVEEDDPIVVDSSIDQCNGLKKPYANWVNEIGHAVLARVNFAIGGQCIDTVHTQFLHAWEELSGKPGKRLEEMIGKRFTRAQLVNDSQRDRTLYIPVPFYFTRHSGNALPLVSLQFHSVAIEVTFAPLAALVQVSDEDVKVYKCAQGGDLVANDLNARVDTTYVYLDMEERDRFAVGSFQQLITQVQHHTTSHTGLSANFQINFNHPALELIWMYQRECHAVANNVFNFSGKYGRDPIRRVALQINNLTRFDREAQYFRMVQPWQHHTSIPRSYVYCYCFALEPESSHPSGTLNFSRIDNVNMQFTKDSSISSENGNFYVFARSWNILRFKEGLGGILYSN